MKTLLIAVAILATLSFQSKESPTTYWIPVEKSSNSIENSLELRRQGIKVLACRCHLNGKIQTGQIIGKECHIRNNGISFVKSKFEVLLANNGKKLKVI